MAKTIFATALVVAVSSKHTPTAVFHGLGDQCINPGMHNFAKERMFGLVVSSITKALKQLLERNELEKLCNSLKSAIETLRVKRMKTSIRDI